jgi:hypothetical protein
MTKEAANVSVPLFASLTVLVLATAAVLWHGARLTKHESRRQPFTTSFLPDALIEFRWPLCVLLVTLVFLAANQLLVRGVAVGTWDVDGQFYPYYVLVADHARAARFLQWDPWSNGGLPSLGDPQVGAFSPVVVALGLLTGGTSLGFRLYWLVLWWLGGWGMLMLGRHLGAPRWGACVVALGFTFCGVYTGNAEHTSWITAFSFLPITIWRLDAALYSGKLQAAAEAGAIWGLSALAGYPGVILLTGCLAALWALGRLVSRGAPEWTPHTSDLVGARGKELTPWFALSALVLMLIVGLLVLLPTYFGFFFEGAGTNPRTGVLSREVALSDSLEPGAFSTFASPYLTALKVARYLMVPQPGIRELWPGTDPSMVNIYAGSVIPSLALLALFNQPRNAWRWWIAWLGVLSIACAMGDTLPFRGWLYDWFYPMRFFRHAAIFRLYYVFAACVLALLATRDLAAEFRTADGRGRPRFFAAALLVASCALLAFVPFLTPEWRLGMPWKQTLLGEIHFAWVWLGVCTVAFLKWRLPYRWTQWCVPVLLVALAASDALVTSVLSMPTVLRVGDPAQRWKDLDQQHKSSLDLTSGGLWREASSCEPDPPSVRCRSNDQLIKKIPVFNSYSTEKNIFHLAMIHDPVLKDMATGGTRIWFSQQVADVPPTEDSFAAFRNRAQILGAPPLVIQTADELLKRGVRESTSIQPPIQRSMIIGRLPAAQRIPVHVVRYLPDELSFNVQTTADGWLLVTDRWARSWLAEVNGRRTVMYGGNFIFRAIRVSAGRNTVRFTFHPLGFPWLVVLSWGTLAVIGLWSVGANWPGFETCRKLRTG